MKRFPDGVEGKFFFEKHIPSHAPDMGSFRHGPVDRRTRGHPLRDGQRSPDAGLGGEPRNHRVPRAAVACRAASQAPRQPRLHGVRPRSRRGHVHRRVLRRRRVGDRRARERGHRSPSPRRAAPRVSSCTRRPDPERRGTRCGTTRTRSHASSSPSIRTWSCPTCASRCDRTGCSSTGARTTRRRRPSAVYSVRAMSAPTVSTPVTLAEVRTCAKRSDPALLRFTTDDVLRRVQAHGDLFGPLALR